jgi:L-ascorbate metabolism protein UlaG (beta-lactamase superfamily)
MKDCKTALFFICIFLFTYSCSFSGHKNLINPDLNHYNNEEFKNLYPSTHFEETIYDKMDFLKENEKGFKKYLQFGFHKSVPIKIDMVKGFESEQFQTTPDLDLLRNNSDEILITWLGHASFLIQFGEGKSILTDPHFNNLPFDFLFERLKRASPSVIKGEELDFVSIIAISHNHYDHLDWETLNNFDKNIAYFVPLKVEKYFNHSYGSVTGMDWYTSVIHKDIKITFLPVNHWSLRTRWDRNETLWGGFLFEYKGKTVFFAGDTGYSKIFEDIHDKYGDIDICLMPITAYKPYRYRRSHLSTETALKAAEDLHSKILIPWGYGTFTLGHEHILEPLRRLHKVYEDKSFSNNVKIKPLKMGETYVFGN